MNISLCFHSKYEWTQNVHMAGHTLGQKIHLKTWCSEWEINEYNL
jgi:hypothetical protein